MNVRGAILGLLGILALGLGVARLRPTARDAESPAGAKTPTETRAPDLGGSRDAQSADDPADAPASVGDPRAELEAARSQLASARETLREAERQIDDLEREVEAVEQFVENIEERGEDPARYAFEGMEQLNPIIDRYEARLATVLEAEEAVVAAESRVRRAEAAVERRPAAD